MAERSPTGGITIPSSGDTTPEYNAVRKSYGEINPAIIPGDFVSQAHSCGLIPTRNLSTPPLDVVLNEISRDPVNFYSLQHVIATLNVENRFDKGIIKMENTFQLEIKKFIPAGSSEHPKAEPDSCPEVFVSFSRRKAYYDDSPDAYAEAKYLYAELGAQGCRPWMDEKGLEYGDALAKETFWAIKQCDFIIPIMTGGYATSLWCLRELYSAVLQKKTIIPMLLEDEAVIANQMAGKWLLRIGMGRKYFKPTKEDKDAMVKYLKDKMVKTQENLPHPSSGTNTDMSDECLKFINQMKSKYQERRVNREKQWPPCHSDKLVRLELVERNKGESYSANTQRGRKDKDIKRTLLAYGDLFKVESGKRRVRKILVEGDAGIGKTTLCVAISEDWANQKLFQQFGLVLLLSLRMKAVASAGSLPELLELLHPSPRLCDSVARYIEDEEGENVLIIADGWDELGETERQKGSFLYQFLYGHRFCLMSVVVTSRPSAAAPLRELPDIDRIVEVRGFSKEHIVEYIQSEFTGDQGKANRLKKQLDDNPLVESVCSVPLNSAIVCHLWRTLEEALPTKLYTKIILNTLLRNIRKIDAYEFISSLPSFTSLPADLQQSWWLLCEFAFQTLKKNQLIFSQEELDAIYPEGLALGRLRGILCFGLLQKAESVLETGCGVSFHFLHLTFQEYLAAQHLARQPADIQLEFLSVCRSTFNVRADLAHSFGMVWKFFFGIHFSKHSGVSSFIQHILECMSSYPRETLEVVESFARPNMLFPIQCAFEAQNGLVNEKVVQYLFNYPLRYVYGTLITFGYPHTAYDTAAILYIIANIQKCDGMKIVLGNSGNREKQTKELLRILANMKGRLWITDLNLSGNRLTNSGLQTLENAVRDDLLSKLEKLNLAGSLTNDTSTNAAWLTSFGEAVLAHCPNLEELDLSDNNLGLPQSSDVSWTCDRHRVTHILNLSNTNIGDDDFIGLLKGLKVISRLELTHNNIGATGISVLADAVSMGKLELMELDTSTLCKLSLDTNPLGLEGAIAVGRMLMGSHCQLNIVTTARCALTTAGGRLPSNSDHYCTISCKGIGQLLCQMPQSTKIGWIDLSGNNFTGEGIHILAGFMHLCPCLSDLSTNECGITSDDLISLVGMLKSFPKVRRKLSRWSLCNNQIDDRGVSTLIESIPSLFPRIGYCEESKIDIRINPVSGEMMERLNDIVRRHKEMTWKSASAEGLALGFDSTQPQSVSHSSTVLPFVHPDDMLPQIESLPRFALYSMDDLAHAIHTKDLQDVNSLADVERCLMHVIEWKDENGVDRELRIYSKIAQKWREIATQLGLQQEEIESINSDYCTSYCCITIVLGQWLENARNLPNASRYPKSWQGLISLLEDTKLYDVVGELKRALSS